MSDHSALNSILAPGGISSLFQPIYRVTAQGLDLHGYECLSRGPQGTNFEKANVLFDYVRLKREEILVDRACVKTALDSGARLSDGDLRLSVNVHASTLGRDATFVDFLRQTTETARIPISKVTVEIVEHAPPWDGVGFQHSLSALREVGFMIALDDVGLGQSNFKMLLDVRPDYLKIDRYFIESCSNDTDRQLVIALLAQLASHFGSEVVAEGVAGLETVGTLQKLGVSLMQGYYFAEPMTADDAASARRNSLTLLGVPYEATAPPARANEGAIDGGADEPRLPIRDLQRS